VRFALLLLVAGSLGCAAEATEAPALGPQDIRPPAPAEHLTISPRTQALGQYPCSDCHQHAQTIFPTGNTGRHGQMRLKHMESIDRCDVCHSLGDMDNLRLIIGDPVSFDESQKVCAQCHGNEARDWSIGIHGKTVGRWFGGERHRFTCVECHDAHAPARPQVLARPAPPRPRFGIVKAAHHD
jgi:hypothetical protein